MAYKLVWFDDGKYYQKCFKADSDRQAIVYSTTYDMGLATCFDLFKGRSKEPLFNEEMWNSPERYNLPSELWGMLES